MADNRDISSTVTMNLNGCIAVLLVLSTLTQYALLTLANLDRPPTSVTTFLGESATFSCSIKDGEILWFVNNMSAIRAPPEYGVSFMPGGSTADCITSTLQIRAIEPTNNSLVECAVGINRRLNRTYFPPTARLLIQGPPVQPPNLQVTIISADMQPLAIELSWEEPYSLINDSVTNYTVKLNISLMYEISERLFLDYENTTTETSLVYNVVQEWIHLCNISSVTVDVLAQNRVGIGETARKRLLPSIDSELCASSSVVALTSVLVSRTVTVVPPVHPGLKAVSPTVNNNRMLIYGGVGGTLVFLLLLMSTTGIIASAHLVLRRRRKGTESVSEECKIHVSPNEAYANVELHKPDQEVHIYEELCSSTQHRGTVITTRNEAYACVTHTA